MPQHSQRWKEPMVLDQDIVVGPMACFTVFAIRVVVSQIY